METNHKISIVFKRKLNGILIFNFKYIIISISLILFIILYKYFIQSSYINSKTDNGFDNKQWNDAWVNE
jgi:hypothetical protein